ncbi:hypoxanthine phosphoribosyltransferase [Polluticoccus soli]|uniref:hypoxanthine phosphoribosyltransferase n=1 Tax=Polluticoccus soli TaxID=3034150 RepID=UPI0023E18FEA|nr:hypoxanthine phosphoribosyltransferase [Flavipsychrobacter sp. JY13-12]
MQKIQVHDKWFEPYISKEKISARVADVATQISIELDGLNPLCIGILNGSFIFAADLFRSLSIDAEISFIKLASYKGTSSTGSIVTAIGLDENLYDRHIIIIEDIIDTGKTLSAFLPEIIQRHPASIRIAAFLTKPEALQHDIHADFVAFEIPDRFVVGYGLDYDGLGRNLPELYILSEE